MDHVDIVNSASIAAPLTALCVRIPPSSSVDGTPKDCSAPEPEASSIEHHTKPTAPASPLQPECWMPDETTQCCMADECQQVFTLFNRRHHCRLCGRIFCHNCCSHTLTVLNARVCAQCYYEHQLVVIRHGSRETRRRSRGELKLLPMTLLARIVSFLPSIVDVARMSLVSSDLYFAARNNDVWDVQYSVKWRSTALSTVPQNGAAPSVGVAHSRYNYSKFLNYVQRATSDRSAKVTSFAAAVRELLNNGIKITIIGPTGIGKTQLVKQFVGDNSYSTKCPTIGFTTYTKRVGLIGDLATETTLTIYDTAGDRRFDSLRALCASTSHAVVLCYDPAQKLTLVDAALVMQELEPHLGEQVVVVCGILQNAKDQREVTPKDAEPASVRCRYSLQVSSHVVADVFEAAVQSVIERLHHAPSKPVVSTPSVLDVLLEQ